MMYLLHYVKQTQFHLRKYQRPNLLTTLITTSCYLAIFSKEAIQVNEFSFLTAHALRNGQLHIMFLHQDFLGQLLLLMTNTSTWSGVLLF